MYIYDEAAAIKAISRLESLKQTKGEYAGQNLKLQSWQRKPLLQLFGNLDTETGYRQIREMFWFLPARQGKTTLAGALALYFLMDPTEPNGFIMSVAPTHKQASFIFDRIEEFVTADPRLSKYLECNKAHKRWVNKTNGTVYQAFSSEPKGVPGADANVVIMDEIHEFQKRDIWDFARSRMSSRRQPLWLTLTTAGKRPDPENLCYQEYLYACKVRDKDLFNDRYLPVIYEAKENAPLTMETVRACNPSLGTIKKEGDIEAELAKALQLPSAQRAFRREQLNQWVNVEHTFYDLDKWKACGADFKIEDLYGCEAWGGYDQGGNEDLGAFALIIKKDNQLYLWQWLTIPKERMAERMKRNKVDYPTWNKQGHIVATEGINAAYVDNETTRKLILDAQKNFKLKYVAIDPSYLREVAVELQAKNKVPIIELYQKGYSLSAAMKETEKMISNGEIKHNNNPCMTWCVSNLVAQAGAYGDLIPSRKKSNEKIDGAAAFIMATAAMMHDRIETLKNGEPRKRITSGKIFF